MALTIIKGAPLWVWPLLAYLLYLGFKSAKQSTQSIKSMYFTPLIMLIGFNNMRTSPTPEVAWPVFALALLLGMAIGFKVQKKWLLERTSATYTVRGEWFTMAALMILFILGFVNGVTKAISPDLFVSAPFAASIAVISGFFSGTFLGRPLRILKTSPEKQT